MRQVAGKKGTGGDSTGMTQKEQKAVIQDFRKGLFNVLVRRRIPLHSVGCCIVQYVHMSLASATPLCCSWVAALELPTCSSECISRTLQWQSRHDFCAKLMKVRIGTYHKYIAGL